MRYKLFVSVVLSNNKKMFLYFFLLVLSIYGVLIQVGANREEPFHMQIAILISVLVFLSMVLYVIKGLRKKIDVLKALGISNWYVISTCCIGFGLFMAGVCLMVLILAMLTL